MPEPIKTGDTISVNYTGKHEDGGVFDTSEGRAPLTFTVGAGQIIQGFDEAVIGMEVGEKKQVAIPPESGYGEHNPELVFTIPRERVPADMQIEEGMQITLTDQEGNHLPAVVDAITEEEVTMDANHPLAGQTLLFDIEVMETGLAPELHCAPGGCGGGCSSC